MATNFLKLSQEAFDASTAWIDTNWRSEWDYSLKAFRNEHASGSSYLSPAFAGRSKLFRPKTRALIRKNEAAAAVALFSNMETAVFAPLNPSDPMSVAAAELYKALVEYRLTHSIPAFPLVMGAFQDAMTTGAVCSYNYWEYERKKGKAIKDKPCIKLRPIENIRIDGGADWLDTVESSPYLCDIIPMYVCQVKGMMETQDEKTGAPKWKKYDEKEILKARPDQIDTTRQARLGNKQQDPHQEEKPISDFDIVWVMRWFMRDSQNDDYTYYTLGTEDLLTEAKPVEEVYFHGKRPYVIGYSVIETHKTFKTPLPVLVKPLQQEMNEIANQRIDNVKFVLNKRWLVARGRQVDVQSLVRNVPGGVTLLTDPKTDVMESNWPDVTSSSYVEQDRLNSDFSDLAGEFSPATKFANKASNDTLGGTRMAQQGAGMMTDYMLRTIIETWYEPTLQHLTLLEKEYETDDIVLSVCGKKAQLEKRGIYGTEGLLEQEVKVTVNVGMGTSNPTERFQKLMVGTKAVMDTVMTAPPNFNVQEFIKEAYSNMGYRDGSRFWSDQADPRLLKAMQMVQQLQGMLQGKQMELQASGQIEIAKIQSNEKIKGAELQVDAQRIAGDLRIRETENAIEAAKVNLDKFIAELEAQGTAQDMVMRMQELRASLEQSQLKIQEQKIKNQGTALKLIADLRKKEEAAVAE